MAQTRSKSTWEKQDSKNFDILVVMALIHKSSLTEVHLNTCLNALLNQGLESWSTQESCSRIRWGVNLKCKTYSRIAPHVDTLIPELLFYGVS